MKKILLIITITLALVTSFIIIKRTKKQNSPTMLTIGILQTASHPALDASRDGFIEELKNKMGNNIEFITQNAQGSIAQAHAIAQQFHANKHINGFFAIATPAAQAMSVLKKKTNFYCCSN